MKRAVLRTLLFVAILGLGCMGVTVPVKADADRFEGQWMGTGTVVRTDPYFPSPFLDRKGVDRWPRSAAILELILKCAGRNSKAGYI